MDNTAKVGLFKIRQEGSVAAGVRRIEALTGHNVIGYISNATLMIGTPVTFLSLVRNLTGTFILAERSSDLQKVYRNSIVSSLIAMLLAIGTSLRWTRC